MIISKKNNKILAKESRILRDDFSKSVGFMFSQKKNVGLVFVSETEQITPMHMMFVFFPIDVLFLDRNKKVIEIKKNFKPFSCYTPKKKAMYVVELMAGIVEKSRTKIGDLIEF